MKYEGNIIIDIKNKIWDIAQREKLIFPSDSEIRYDSRRELYELRIYLVRNRTSTNTGSIYYVWNIRNTGREYVLHYGMVISCTFEINSLLEEMSTEIQDIFNELYTGFEISRDHKSLYILKKITIPLNNDVPAYIDQISHEMIQLHTLFLKQIKQNQTFRDSLMSCVSSQNIINNLWEIPIPMYPTRIKIETKKQQKLIRNYHNYVIKNLS